MSRGLKPSWPSRPAKSPSTHLSKASAENTYRASTSRALNTRTCSPSSSRRGAGRDRRPFASRLRSYAPVIPMCALPSVTQMARTRGTTPPVDVINNMGNCPIFQHLSPPFPHPTPPLHPLTIGRHPRAYVRKHNMLCLTQRRDATCSTPPFNLNLQVDLEAIFTSLYIPFTSPPNSPTRGMCTPPRHWPVAQNGTDPRLPKRAQQHVPAIGGPSSDSM